jgi:predicted glycosyltransferase involved in capsule biosynthesis
VHNWRFSDWLRARLRGQINRITPLLKLPIARYMKAKRWQGAKTCNLAVWRQYLIRVNGLDETYSGWGMEDSDLVIRLLHAGIHHKSGRYAAPVLHLWHPENDRSSLQKNIAKLDQLIESARVEAQLGINQYK